MTRTFALLLCVIFLLQSCQNEKAKKTIEEIITDAPTDNNGKGEAFSPTDLAATALGSCAITVMGIAARKKNIELRIKNKE